MLWIFGLLFVWMLTAILIGYWFAYEDAGHPRTLNQIHTHVHTITQQLGALVMASAELKAVLARIDTATNNIAEDIRRIKEQIGTGMTPAEVAEVQASAEALAAKLEALAADTEDPIPDEPV